MCSEFREVIWWKAHKMEGAMFWNRDPNCWGFLACPWQSIFCQEGRSVLKRMLKSFPQVWSLKKIWNCKFLEFVFWWDLLLSCMLVWYFGQSKMCSSPTEHPKSATWNEVRSCCFMSSFLLILSYKSNITGIKMWSS